MMDKYLLSQEPQNRSQSGERDENYLFLPSQTARENHSIQRLWQTAQSVHTNSAPQQLKNLPDVRWFAEKIQSCFC